MSTIESPSPFTPEEIAHQSMLNAQAMAIALVAQGRGHGQDAGEVARWLGGVFAPGWEGLRGGGAFRATRTAALNLVSIGCTLVELDGDEREARVRLTSWVDDSALAAFGVPRDAGIDFLAVFEPIAEFLGLDYRWDTDGDTVTMTLNQQTR